MTEEKLEESSLVDTNFGRSDGSEVIFLGITRDNNFDRNVSKLFYESYQDMALLEIEKIIFQALPPVELFTTSRVSLCATSSQRV